MVPLSTFVALASLGCSSQQPTGAPAESAPAVVEPASAPGPMDHHPGRRTLSPGGSWEIVVAPGGDLSVQPAGDADEAIPLDRHVDARVAVSADERWLVYARQGGTPETDLWRVQLPDGQPEQLTTWRGSEDRPVLSPDGQSLAFVSGQTGIASWWRVDLGGDLPVDVDQAQQLTNVGVEDRPRSPGQPPAGWVPVPEGHDYAWTDAGLSWVSRGQRHALAPPDLQP